jgi:hypothetical protein
MSGGTLLEIRFEEGSVPVYSVEFHEPLSRGNIHKPRLGVEGETSML